MQLKPKLALSWWNFTHLKNFEISYRKCFERVQKPFESLRQRTQVFRTLRKIFVKSSEIVQEKFGKSSGELH